MNKLESNHEFIQNIKCNQITRNKQSEVKEKKGQRNDSKETTQKAKFYKNKMKEFESDIAINDNYVNNVIKINTIDINKHDRANNKLIDENQVAKRLPYYDAVGEVKNRIEKKNDNVRIKLDPSDNNNDYKVNETQPASTKNYHSLKKDSDNNVNKSNSSGEQSTKSNSSANKISSRPKDKNIAFSEEEWNEIIKNKSFDNISSDKLRASLKAGVSDDLRGKIWTVFSKCLEAAVYHSEDIYSKLVEVKNQEIENLIKRDLERTLLYTVDGSGDMKLIEYKNKIPKLYRILKAYAIYDSEVSYMQGTNFIVAVLLNNIKSEKACFWIFYQIMNKHGWRNFFIEGTPKLMKMLDVLTITIKEEIPELYIHFEKEKFIEMIPAVFTQFFVTICTYNAPVEYACRIIDFFWIYKEKIIFEAITHLLKIQVEKIHPMDLEEMHKYIKCDIIFDVVKIYGIDRALPF